MIGFRIPFRKPKRDTRFDECVALGMLFLDDAVPGWDDRITPKTLNMASSNDCVLGQLYGSYWVGMRQLRVGYHAAERFGFAYDIKHCNSMLNGATEYRVLTQAWVAKLAQREREWVDA